MKLILYIALALFAVILEISFFPVLLIWGIVPHIFLMFILASFFIVSEDVVFYTALAGALIIGLFYPVVWGSYAIAVFAVLLITHLLHSLVFTNINATIMLLFSVISTLIFDFIIILFSFFNGREVSILNYFQSIFFVQVIFSIVFVSIWYWALSNFWEKFTEHESFRRLLR